MSQLKEKQRYKSSRRLQTQSPKRIFRNSQIDMLEKQPHAYGGELLKTRKGRSCARTLSTKNTMHLVLRSSRATGELSFSRPQHKAKISQLFHKFSRKYGVRIINVANAGNHIHAQIQLTKRHLYFPFIRGLTAAIAMSVSGVSRWSAKHTKGQKFWDYRPFTRVVIGYRAVLSLKDYLLINRLEGWYTRSQARFLIAWRRNSYSHEFSSG
jgi:REP element-mobilizing transposase RayT